jgi:hypothetical protein
MGACQWLLLHGIGSPQLHPRKSHTAGASRPMMLAAGCTRHCINTRGPNMQGNACAGCTAHARASGHIIERFLAHRTTWRHNTTHVQR